MFFRETRKELEDIKGGNMEEVFFSQNLKLKRKFKMLLIQNIFRRRLKCGASTLSLLDQLLFLRTWDTASSSRFSTDHVGNVNCFQGKYELFSGEI